MFDRDLYKTKLCTLYQRGHCPRQSCSFAHGDAELRRYSSPANGHSPSRSPPRGSERRERKRQRVDGNLSDVSEDHKNTGDGSDDGRTKEMKSPYISPRDTLEEQYKGDDEEVDVEGVDAEDRGINLNI